MTPVQVSMALDCVIINTIRTQMLAAYNTLRWWKRLRTVSTGGQICFRGRKRSIHVQAVGGDVVVP